MASINQQSESMFSFDNQDMMVFILIMSLHGLQMMFAELLPSFSLGGLELEINRMLLGASYETEKCSVELCLSGEMSWSRKVIVFSH